MLQVISFYILKEKDAAFDKEYYARAVLATKGVREEVAPSYITVFNIAKNALEADHTSIEFTNSDKSEFHILYWAKTIVEKVENPDELHQILEKIPPQLSGYSKALQRIVNTIDINHPDIRAEIAVRISELSDQVSKTTRKINSLPEASFHLEVKRFIETKNDALQDIYDTIRQKLETSETVGAELKKEIVGLLVPVTLPGNRIYRTIEDARTLFICYRWADTQAGIVYEVGYPYETYRKYMHPTVLKFSLILIVSLIIIRFGYQYFFMDTLVTPLITLSKGVRQVDAGKLDISIPIRQEDEIGYITRCFNKMAASLKVMVGTIDDNSNQVRNASEQLNNASSSLTNIAKELATIAEETTASYEEMSSSFESNLESVTMQLQHSEEIQTDISNISTESTQLGERIAKLNDRINDAMRKSEEGEKTIGKSVKVIAELAKYLKDIEGTINAINEVADKINLLALNAAIEAARAGEAGRGFSVVADEVNKLADQTTELVKGIQSTIMEQTNRISGELSYISNSSKILSDIRSSISETRFVLDESRDFTASLSKKNLEIERKINSLGEVAKSIYDFSLEQKTVLQELTKAVNFINDLSQNTLSSAETVGGYAQIIDHTAKELSLNIAAFTKSSLTDGS